MWAALLLQAILILLNAFFASAEIAVLSLNDSRVRKRAEEGDRKAARLVKLLDHPDAFLSTIQIGITLGNLLGSAFAAENFSDPLSQWLGNLFGIAPAILNTPAVILITLVLSYFTLVLGELVPKRIAMKKTEAVARRAVTPIGFLARIMRPVVWLLSVSTNGALRLLRIDPKAEEASITEEDILLLVDAGSQRGSIQQDEQTLIRNVFHFDNITARDVMTHRIHMEALPLDADREDVFERIVTSGHSRLPIYEGTIDHIVGVLHTRTFLQDYLREPGKGTPLGELMTPGYFVPETLPADQLFRQMQREKVRMAIVVDNYGGTSGVITLKDLVEEIVGEIQEEAEQWILPAPPNADRHEKDVEPEEN